MLGKRIINSNDAGAPPSSCTTNTNDYPTTNVAYYKMSTAADEKDTYNGTASNVNFNVQGKFGNAGEFNGTSSKITIPSISPKSISMWVNVNSTSGIDALMGHDSITSNFIYWNTGDLRVDSTIFTNLNKVANQWVHIALVESGSNIICYNNGTPIQTLSGSLGTYNLIGGRTAGTPQYLDGSLDQVRIFSSALDATQVESLYNEVYCVPTIVPTDNFNSVLYTGTGSGSKSVTGVGFQPDLVWGKARNSGTLSHILFDVVRGENKQISADLPDAQVVRASAAYEFDDDGFTVTTAGNLNNPNDFVAWSWKAGGAAVSNTDGTITSQVSANVDAGFSIVSYTGTGSTATVGHGLNQSVELIIVKNISASASWAVYSAPTGINKFLELNSSGAATSYSNYWGAATPTNDVFGVVNGNFNNNATNASLIAYCFHSVDGFSRIGSYKGTGAAGNTIVTGFRPAFVMTKRIDSTGNWFIVDAARNTTDPRTLLLLADTSAAEQSISGFNFTSNGFSFNGVNNNGSGATYIFMAFAEEALPYVTRNATNPFGDSSEVALYKFEDDATDAEGNYDAISSPNVTYATGYIDKAAVFNGSSSEIEVSTTSTTPVDFSSKNYSLSLWVNTTSTTLGVLLSKYGDDDTTRAFTLQSRANGTVQQYERSTGSSVSTDTTTTINDGNWHHIVVVRSSTSTIIYIDNSPTTNNNTFTSNNGGTEPFRIGRDNIGSPDYFNGKIDQVRIFNRALDSGEVTALYNE